MMRKIIKKEPNAIFREDRRSFNKNTFRVGKFDEILATVQEPKPWLKLVVRTGTQIVDMARGLTRGAILLTVASSILEHPCAIH